MMKAAATVYLVDDDAGMLRALTRLLEAEDFAVLSFRDARDFLKHPCHDEVSCVVLDMAMPGIDGLQLQQRLVSEGNPIPVVFLTGHGDIPMSVRAMKSGAVDFLTKPVKDVDLIRAVNTALAVSRSRRKDQALVEDLRGRYGRLTSREREVMGHLIKGKLNKQIAADLGTSVQTVKVHRMRMMEKMGFKSLVELVHAAEKLGVSPP